jgi:signal transduction histidine kinase
VSNAASDEPLPEAVDRLRAEVAELRESRKRLARTADAERRELERVLHDGAQQSLVALAFGLQRLSGLLERDPAAARRLLEELAANAKEATDETMELARRIYPPMLEARGLTLALRAAAAAAGVTLEMERPSGARLPPEVAAVIYWSCVDALSSARPDSHAAIRVRDANGTVTFELSIVGQQPADRLQRLRDRIEALDGRVSVDALPDGTTRVQGWLASSS